MSKIVPPPPMVQVKLFQVEKQTEIDGVEMGVLENGIPYLTESGLARMCGIDRKVLNRLATNWKDEQKKPRGRTIRRMLQSSGYDEDDLFLKSVLNGSVINAYTEPVCIALLEYYAFLADEKRIEAERAFRALARRSFRDFVYAATGYAPQQKILEGWRHFHDRVNMTKWSCPPGFFGVFNEIAVMLVPMINAGILISDKVVPDISVGLAWAKHWRDKNLAAQHGERVKYDHEYPDYYPQSASNPQEAWAYPESCLGEFRQWLREAYIAFSLPKYMHTKAKQGGLDSGTAMEVIASLTRPAIEE